LQHFKASAVLLLCLCHRPIIVDDHCHEDAHDYYDNCDAFHLRSWTRAAQVAAGYGRSRWKSLGLHPHVLANSNEYPTDDQSLYKRELVALFTYQESHK